MPCRSVAAVTAGLAGNLCCYVVLVLVDAPWLEVGAAFLTGLSCGLLWRRPTGCFLAAAATTLGWLLGTVMFGLAIDLGVGAWLPAGALLGCVAGAHAGSWWRGAVGLIVGIVVGGIVEASRWLTVLMPPLRLVDMQLLLLVFAGLLFPLAARLLSGRLKA
jgi:hypothetical protein